MIRVILASYLGTLFEIEELELEARDVREALDQLVRRLGPPFEARLRSCRVLVDGRNIAFEGGTSAVLKEGDEVVILPPMAGG
jgi:molybdopterin converting factor small subunit